jgi:putative endonuclease
VTSNLRQRVQQHRLRTGGFAGRYRLTRLVFAEHAPDARSAIEREKQIKGWLRSKKIELIESVNPGWQDLASEP